MHAFSDIEEGIGEPRPHPWQGSACDPNAKFVDFLEYPELIRTSLEDFAPYSDRPAIERFFQLLEWMRSPSTIWETTESKFWPVSTQSNQSFAQYRVICSGRLVFFCRNHLWQCKNSQWAFTQLLKWLKDYAPVAPNACVGVFTVPTLFVSLSEDGGVTAPECKALGVRCYGFGDSEDEAFDGFDAGVDAVRSCTEKMTEMIIAFGDLKV